MWPVIDGLDKIIGPRFAGENVIHDRRALRGELAIFLLGQDDGRRLAPHTDVLRPVVDSPSDDLAQPRLGLLQLPHRPVDRPIGVRADGKRLQLV